MSELESFARLIAAIEPWRAHLVLVGGWAQRLYRHHELAGRPSYAPLITRDTDLAFSNHAPLQGDIKSALVAAGFTEDFVGDSRPPAIHYALGDDDAGFYAEFLTPLTGSGIKRSGKPDATLLKAGISAQKLRHLDLLLIDPWKVQIGEGQGIPLHKPLELQIPNPVSYVVQKLLIREDRRPEKRAQDVLYIHDTLELFSGSLPALRRLWIESINRGRPREWFKTFSRPARLSLKWMTCFEQPRAFRLIAHLRQNECERCVTWPWPRYWDNSIAPFR